MCSFLYNICCLNNFIESSTPIEIRWITLVYYKNDVYACLNAEKNYFQRGSAAMLSVENCCFGHVTSVCMRFYTCRPTCTHRLKWRRDIAKERFSIWRPSVRHLKFIKFRILSNDHSRNGNSHLRTQFDRNRIMTAEIDKVIFKMAAVRHLDFANIDVLNTRPISACDSSSLIQISH